MKRSKVQITRHVKPRPEQLEAIAAGSNEFVPVFPEKGSLDVDDAEPSQIPELISITKVVDVMAVEESGPIVLFDEEVRFSVLVSPSRTFIIIQFMLQAFYLFKHGHMNLVHKDGSAVDIEGLWQKFLEKNRLFPVKYKAYEFFRDQG